MTPILLAVVGALLAGTALIGRQAAAGRVAAALVLVGVGGGLWWSGTGAGAHPITLTAQTPAGAPVTSQALVQPPNQRRDAVAVAFERRLPVETPLLLMVALGLLGAAAARRDALGLGLAAGATAMGGWAASTCAAAGGSFSGEQAARDQLVAALPDVGILQFTVPTAWQFDASAPLLATGIATGAALVWLGLGGRLKANLASLAAVGAALAALACVWQVLAVGGFPWRGTEGALAATALGTGAAWMLREAPLLAGSVAGLSLAAALLGIG